ncbi:MAG: sialidase family protein [Planctomycetota bacterium]|nr:sialidase family protein [Planctomycetota bacterium]
MDQRFLLIALMMAGACATHPPPHPKMPSPTEHLLDDAAESLGKIGRKEYMRQIHRAPPDVDWKEIEKRNGERQRLKRNALAQFAATGSRWTERGSDNLAGRMHVAAPSPDGQTLYAGSSRGGVWRGTPDGGNWTPIGDNIYGGAHWLVVVPGDTIGDPDALLAATDGGRISRSTDQGQTWLYPAGLPDQDDVEGVRRLLVSSDGTWTVFAVLRYWKENGPPWGGQSLRYGLFRSTDRGQTFSIAQNMGNHAGDIWMPRNGGSTLYLLKGDELYVSIDLGQTVTLAGTLGTTGGTGVLSGSEAGAPRLYAIVDDGGTNRLLRSDDAGASWTIKTDVTDYWGGSMSASIVNPDLVAWGGVEVHRSVDGGSNFSIVNPWWEYYGNEANKLHADIPGIDVLPGGPAGEIWYISTDGGLFRSFDGLASVENLSLDGLRVSQYYSTHTSSVNPLHVVAGAQDQGYQWASAPPSPGGTTLSFDQLISGDYAQLTSSDGSHNYLYSVYPGFILIHKGENNPTLYTEDFPDNESYPWLPVVVADPYSISRFFFCAKSLYRYQQQALNSWSPSLWSTHNFEEHSGEYLTGLAFSSVDAEKAYAVTNWGAMYFSDDHGVTWTRSTTTGMGSGYLHGHGIVASSLDKDRGYVGGSGYGTPSVWRTTNGGLTFDPWDDGLPDTLVYCLAEGADGTLFAGTETAAYKRGANDAVWTDITSNEAPVTTYWSAEWVPSETAVRFGTYGRGIWDYSMAQCTYQAYGVGLGGANVLSLDSTSSSHVGQVQLLQVTGGAQGSSGMLLAGFGATELPLKGGTLLVNPSPWVLIPITVPASGTAVIPLFIPNDPLAYDLEIVFQAALADSGQSAGWAFSNGLAATLCQP